ncbi:porin family protein [Sphingomonas lutea]|uniref:Porin family protein n=1 Tax=Sphingomonas lutea TaxID=1045317 RepID=A0A7G9SHR1_9SPHN|nr:outer membrane beta-barrel protein [Sphingomonas lutea]QNN67386.1 porin family protein [Sphingomonas lutea]
MKRILLAGAALALMTTPAVARDNSAYFGIEVGPMWVSDVDAEVDGVEEFEITHKLGVDGDLIAGYDFGLLRAEVEGGHKWAKHDDYSDGVDTVPASGHSRAWSLMGNAMIDLGNNETVNFYAGAGVGIAWVRHFVEEGDDDLDDGIGVSDQKLAWQFIAGVRAPVFRHFDVGVKYRYFNAGKIEETIDDEVFEGRFRSHSLLASLIYNFAATAAPPPPPPPPPRRRRHRPRRRRARTGR